MSPKHSRRAGDSVLGRRSFLTGTAAVTGLLFAGFSAPVRAETVLPAFPEGLSLRKAQFRNWDEAIVTEDLWTVAIGSADDAVRVAEWARINSYTLRPHGFRHNWSPLVVDSGTPSSARVLLLDMTTLNSMAMVDDTVVEVGPVPLCKTYSPTSTRTVAQYFPRRHRETSPSEVCSQWVGTVAPSLRPPNRATGRCRSVR